jgi:hypothetical protein
LYRIELRIIAKPFAALAEAKTRPSVGYWASCLGLPLWILFAEGRAADVYAVFSNQALTSARLYLSTGRMWTLNARFAGDRVSDTASFRTG